MGLVTYIISFACLPAQQHAVVEAVSKGLDLPREFRQALNLPEPALVPFTPLSEIERALHRQLEQIDLEGLARRVFQDALDRVRGRV